MSELNTSFCYKHWSKILFFASCVHLLSGSTSCADKAAEAAAKETLITAGLLLDGFVWVTPEESKLFKAIDRLQKLEQDYLKAVSTQQEFSSAQASIAAKLNELMMKKAALQAQLNSGTLSISKQKSINQELARLLEIISSTEQQLGTPGMREGKRAFLSNQVAKAYAALQIDLIRIERITDDQLEAKYLKLKNDHKIQAALEVLKERYQLGPKRNATSGRRKAVRLQQTYITNLVPVIVFPEVYRIPVIIDGAKNVFFDYRADKGYSMVKVSDLVAAGIEIPKQDQLTLSLGTNTVTGYYVPINALQLGPYQIVNKRLIAVEGDAIKVSHLGKDILKQFKISIQSDSSQINIQR